MRLQILTSAKSPGISGGLTYESETELPEGAVVKVPLRNKSVEGIVLGTDTEPRGDFDLKRISETLTSEPFLHAAQIRTLRWMAKYYCCSLRQAMRVFLPANPWGSLLPQPQLGYRVIDNREIRGKAQQKALDYLTAKDWVTWDEIRTETGVTKTTMTALVKSGILAEDIRTEDLRDHEQPQIAEPNLTAAQHVAYEGLTKTRKPTLLFGITGSGKTEVYAKLIADMVHEDKQTILLVPEILLTEHSIQRFTKLMDRQHIAVIHSRLTPAERREEWKRIRYGNVKLVIGSRSALFAPVQNLGAVIIDEEHEWTYKNEQTPRYHARDTAEMLCQEFGAKLLLGTATPSLEAWKRVEEGTYDLQRLDDRYNDAQLPKVLVVDLAQVEFGNNYPFSNTLLDAINERLHRQEQSVLFLNRRGVATSLLCLDCRRRVMSPESNLPFTVHRSRGDELYLQDHTTGAIAKLPAQCPGCQSTRLRPVGAGTQRIEDILHRKFPQARILRADSDTLTHPDQMRELLHTMNENRADILLGTQTVVKGLDLPNVTLAAVLVADVGMSLPHFRAGERTFQLLTQLTGRSGRSKPGEVVIQTFRPEAPEVKLSALHATEDYLKYELDVRKKLHYPPYTPMVRLIARGPDARKSAELAGANLRKNEGLRVGCSPTLFGGGNIWHVLARGEGVHEAVATIDTTDVVIDVDPMDCV